MTSNITVSIVVYCPRCDYYGALVVQSGCVGDHLCLDCDRMMDVFIAQETTEIVVQERQKEPTFTELLDAKMEECHPNDPKRCLNPLHRHHDPMWPGFHGNIRDYDWKTQDDGTILGTPKS